ncbi:MAG: hypothetical protein ACFFC7_20235 [Candidatus Hermodarchaeota archaeon]
MENKDRHNCALDLVYEATILDHFVHYTPYVGSLHIEFLRNKKKEIRALVFKDYDGDKHEQIEFVKTELK